MTDVSNVMPCVYVRALSCAPRGVVLPGEEGEADCSENTVGWRGGHLRIVQLNLQIRQIHRVYDMCVHMNGRSLYRSVGTL